MRGTIHTLNKFFCHCTLDTTAERVFVHSTNCDFILADCVSGDVVEIGKVIETPKGLRGEEVTWIDRPSTADICSGVVTAVHAAKGMAFMVPDDGRSPHVFLHARQFTDYVGGWSEVFSRLTPGTRLTCHRRRALPNPVGELIAIEKAVAA